MELCWLSKLLYSLIWNSETQNAQVLTFVLLCLLQAEQEPEQGKQKAEHVKKEPQQAEREPEQVKEEVLGQLQPA